MDLETWLRPQRELRELQARTPFLYLAQQYFKTQQDFEAQRILERQRQWIAAGQQPRPEPAANRPSRI